MADKCAFCGHTVNFFKSYTECIYKPDGKYTISPVPVIKNAAPGLGFCERNGCADRIGAIASFLYRAGLLDVNYPLINYCSFYPDKKKKYEDINYILESVNYCKANINKVQDAAIKSTVQKWVNDVEKHITATNNIKQDVFTAYKHFKEQINELDNSINKNKLQTCTIDYSIWLAFNGENLFLDHCLHDLLSKYSYLSSSRLDKSFAECLEICELFRGIKSIEYLTIPVNKIIYFKKVGQVQYTSDISGGKVSGGGVNIGAAAMGGMLFGTAGAIVGSQIGTEISSEGIHTTTKKHDDRKISLRWTDENDKIQELLLGYESYEFFMNCFPEKEHSLVTLNALESKQKSVEEVVEKQETTISEKI